MTRVDDLARSLAVRSPRGGAVERVRVTGGDLALERAARALATPMPRRRALRLAAGAAAAVLLGPPPARARAQGGLLPCPPVENPTFTQPCGLSSCCHPTAQCCAPTDEGFVNCCYPSDGYKCGGPPDPRTRRPTCICIGQSCGEDCCREDQECIRGLSSSDPDFCSTRCAPGEIHCRGTGECCSPGEQCCGSGCCSDGHCCERDGVEWCCEETDVCGETARTCGCPFAQRCYRKCCPAGAECCSVALAV